jgi:protein-tyrosine phosphatase
MRLAIVAAAVCLAVLGYSAADEAAALIRKDTNIPPQALAPALQTLAKDYNFQVRHVPDRSVRLYRSPSSSPGVRHRDARLSGW